MKNTHVKAKSQAGFTLVELAIVMIIIGLLIGGILKGQELIGNAQVASSVTQIKSIEAATNTFFDQYNAMPGDMLTPDQRLPSCANNCATAGNGNGRVDSLNPGEAQVADNENSNFWLHLAATGLLSGVENDSVDMVWGRALPSSSVGGGYTVGYAANVAALDGAMGADEIRAGHFVALRADPAVVGGGAGGNSLTPSQAARIDRKMDDGLPETGFVRAYAETAADCGDDANYNEAADALACGIYARIRN